mgnify:CR=1 FL=1
MILCVYLMIPVISIGLRKLGDKFFYALCAVAVMSSMIIPNINTVLRTLDIEKSIQFALSTTDIFSIYTCRVLGEPQAAGKDK